MYMETTVFILCILLGLAILSMGVITCLQVIVGSRERKELGKTTKRVQTFVSKLKDNK